METVLGARSGTALGDGWVRSACTICMNRCGILAHVNDDNVVDKILGDPDNPHNHGRTCAKGDAGFEGLTDPDRITTPLRRTNPEKGVGVDPGWVPISWDEALDEIAGHLRDTIADDPEKILYTSFDIYHLRGALAASWVTGLGMPGYSTWSAAIFCGNNVHGILYMNQNAFESNPDPIYSRYILNFGAQFGSVVHYDTMHSTHELSARRSDVRMVSVDPVCSSAAAVADEWVPIRPGTDAALILGMVDQLINELGIYDAEFLKNLTNAAYLVGADGRYIRDPASGKPLVWDEHNGAQPFDAGTGNAALTGVYEVDGVEARPGFQILADHVRSYTPEYVESITTVPADTVRRLAKEFGEAACIGQTIEIDGVELPYRPATVAWYRGLSAHKHSMLNGLAIILLPTLIGGIDVPGGLLGDPWGLIGKVKDLEYTATASPDGLISQGFIGGGRVGGLYPPRPTGPPRTTEMWELLPCAPYGTVFSLLNSEQPELFGSPPFPSMMINFQSNMMKSSGPPDIVERFIKRIPFVAAISRRFEETTMMADIVLPDVHYLERMTPLVYQHLAAGDSPHAAFGAKPVVASSIEGPVPGEPFVDAMQIYLELSRRAGRLPHLYEAFNNIAKLREPYKLDPDGDYSYFEICDRWLKNTLGEDKGLDWHLRDGLWTADKTVQQKYPRPFFDARAQVYCEFMVDTKVNLERTVEELGIPWETDDYQPVPDWKPGPAYERTPPHDLFVINMKVPNHALSHTHKNSILSTLSTRHNDLRSVWINPKTAAARGISHGDLVEIETSQGRKQTATARVTQLVHPEVLATQGCGGGWSKGSGGDEVNFNALLNIDVDHIDFVSGALDCAIAADVRTVPASGGGAAGGKRARSSRRGASARRARAGAGGVR